MTKFDRRRRQQNGNDTIASETANDHNGAPDGARGNAFRQQQLQKRQHGDSATKDRRLNRVRSQLNDSSLTPEDRIRTLLFYRNSLLPSVDMQSMFKMRNNDSSMPVYADGDQKGMFHPLYSQLGQSEQSQSLMGDLSQRILDTDSSQLNIDDVWRGTRDTARSLHDEEEYSAASDLEALRAMATLANYYKAPRDEKGKAQLPEGIPDELWEKIDAAGTALATSTSPDAAVMSRGVAPKHVEGEDFTSDRNFHFFSHAYLAANLQQQHGVAPKRAQATSGFIGSQYELLPSSFQETSGNAGLKDVLVNAEGAAFGSSLMKDPATALPGAQDGPALEDRTWDNADSFDQTTQSFLDKGNDLSIAGMLRSLF